MPTFLWFFFFHDTEQSRLVVLKNMWHSASSWLSPVINILGRNATWVNWLQHVIMLFDGQYVFWEAIQGSSYVSLHFSHQPKNAPLVLKSSVPGANCASLPASVMSPKIDPGSRPDTRSLRHFWWEGKRCGRSEKQFPTT